MGVNSPVEHLFTTLNKTAEILQEELLCSYLDAIAETGENLFHETILQDEVSELTKKRLEKEYNLIKMDKFSNEEIRKAFQLLILKGMKNSSQPNHQMTPDTVGLFISYLITKLMEKKTSFTILDPAIGSGNLLTTILNQNSNKEITGFGVDIDDLLLKLAYVSANLQQHSIQLFNQDSLEQLFIEPVDLVVSDLPVGYYPNDIGAEKFELRAEKGHSYSHHLFIEQSMKQVKEGGYLLFLIPNTLFNTEQAVKLNQYIKENSYIQGLIQLPISLFASESAAKSIFILQKKGTDVTPPKQALLVDLPKFSNKVAMNDIIERINEWFKAEKSESSPV
ncbi:class I SAM-dependent methyltransferase [Cytobacillus suaedae]|nr:class I SAM-dependent methyltransferase [Cytobacillus suaedae]